MKLCKKCGRHLSEESFAKNAKAKDGLQLYCRDCTRRYYESRKAMRNAAMQGVKASSAAATAKRLVASATELLRTAYALESIIKGETRV